jgi:Rieske Fe-S protein
MAGPIVFRPPVGMQDGKGQGVCAGVNCPCHGSQGAKERGRGLDSTIPFKGMLPVT